MPIRECTACEKPGESCLACEGKGQIDPDGAKVRMTLLEQSKRDASGLVEGLQKTITAILDERVKAGDPVAIAGRDFADEFMKGWRRPPARPFMTVRRMEVRCAECKTRVLLTPMTGEVCEHGHEKPEVESSLEGGVEVFAETFSPREMGLLRRFVNHDINCILAPISTLGFTEGEIDALLKKLR